MVHITEHWTAQSLVDWGCRTPSGIPSFKTQLIAFCKKIPETHQTQPRFFTLQQGLPPPSLLMKKKNKPNPRLLHVPIKYWHGGGLLSVLYKQQPKNPLLCKGSLPYSPSLCLAMEKVWTLVLLPQKGKYMCLAKWWGEEMRGPLGAKLYLPGTAVWEGHRWNFHEG